MNKTAVFKKIPLYDLIDVLHRIYDEGADYVDISGKISPTEDSIFLIVKDEYYSTNLEEKKLTDEDLNLLI